MRTVHSVIKRTPRRYLAEIVMIDDFSNKGSVSSVFISSSDTLNSTCLWFALFFKQHNACATKVIFAPQSALMLVVFKLTITKDL